MAEPPILEECRTLLQELEWVENRISRLTGDMVDSVGDQHSNEITREGLITAHSEAEEQFAALRARIVALGRSYSLCPQQVPDGSYSPSGLRGLLQSIQRKEQGFKQPAPESLEASWERLPSDVLASLEDPTKHAAELISQFHPEERLPSDVERFLDRVISEANHAVLAETKLPDGETPSLPITSVPQPRQKPELAPKESAQPRQISTQQRQVSENHQSAAEAKALPVAISASPQASQQPQAPEAKAPSVEVSAPPSVSAPLPAAVLEVASAAEKAAAAAEERFQQEAATRDWKPASMTSGRDYQDLLEYGEGKLGLGRAEFADLLANLALLNHKQGRFEDAEELHRKELMIRENELGRDHPKVATSLNNLALLCRDLGRLQEARELWERSLAIVENAFGPDHPKVALRLSNLADLLQDSGKTTAAERYYQRLMKLREAGNVGKKREVKSSLRKYAELLRSSRRKRDARKVEAQIITGGPGWFPRWR